MSPSLLLSHLLLLPGKMALVRPPRLLALPSVVCSCLLPLRRLLAKLGRWEGLGRVGMASATITSFCQRCLGGCYANAEVLPSVPKLANNLQMALAIDLLPVGPFRILQGLSIEKSASELANRTKRTKRTRASSRTKRTRASERTCLGEPMGWSKDYPITSISISSRLAPPYLATPHANFAPSVLEDLGALETSNGPLWARLLGICIEMF